MWIRLNDEVELPEKGHHMTFDLEDNGNVLKGAKIIGKLIEDEEGKTNRVSVRWHDGYLEEFEATEVRFGSDLLWMRLTDGKNRHIPLRSVRWFALSKESHQSGEHDEA